MPKLLLIAAAILVVIIIVVIFVMQRGAESNALEKATKKNWSVPAFSASLNFSNVAYFKPEDQAPTVNFPPQLVTLLGIEASNKTIGTITVKVESSGNIKEDKGFIVKYGNGYIISVENGNTALTILDSPLTVKGYNADRDKVRRIDIVAK